MRILSGIQPSGALHIGNYFGMMKPAIELQERGEAYYFIANYHSMTSLFDPEERRKNSLDVALDFLACGLDPEKSVFWKQSDVPEVTELTWLLSTMTPMGLLKRCHSYKDKLSKLSDGDEEKVNHGLFAYPVLMAADILAFDSTLVPVGKDQKQHLEVARDIANKFNNQYGETFVVPEPEIRESVATVPGTDGQKMSKSYGNTVEIFGEEKKLRKKIMKIVTDSTPVEDSKDPDDSYIVELFQLFASPDEVAEMKDSFRSGGQGYGHYKQQLFEAIRDHFAPMRERREELERDSAYVDGVLEAGAKRAREKAREVVDRVRSAVGM